MDFFRVFVYNYGSDNIDIGGNIMNKMLRMFLASILAVALCFSLTACSGNESKTNDGQAGSEAGSNAFELKGWNVEVSDVRVTNNLSDTSTSIGYGGDISSEVFEKKPSDESLNFCLVKFKMDKVDSSDVIKWDNVTVVDQDGSVYNRIDDSFLEDVGFKRLKSSDINFGENEGWISYEVPQSTTSLKLRITIGEETKEIELDISK